MAPRALLARSISLAPGSPGMRTKRRNWFNRAAEGGDPGAQADLAALLQMGVVSSFGGDPPPVHEWFERAAEQGDLVGAFNFAVCLAEGVGVSRNDERAAFWLRRAAEGVVEAQYWYGQMLAEGRGMAKDGAAAAVWFTLAADFGMPQAQVALAELHVNGHGVSRDHRLAESLVLTRGVGRSRRRDVRPRSAIWRRTRCRNRP